MLIHGKKDPEILLQKGFRQDLIPDQAKNAEDEKNGSCLMKCSKCEKEFDRQRGEGAVASISGGIMGDEYIESFYFCSVCQVYTVEIYHDRFLGEEEISIRGPVPKSEGESQIKLIKQCSRPWDKKCRCEAHRSYFGPSLD